jgi:uncharacterized protein
LGPVKKAIGLDSACSFSPLSPIYDMPTMDNNLFIDDYAFRIPQIMDNKKVIVRKTSKYGKGVFAIETIHNGEVIASFDGKVWEGETSWSDDVRDHAIQFAPNRFRDSKGIARLINHSCEPNCGIKKYFNVVAMRTIYPGEEVTWDYEMTENTKTWSIKCQCGSKTCRKVIGAFSNMPAHVRRAYKGFISDWLVSPKKSAKVKLNG